MIKKVEPTKVTDIFPIEGKVIYEIPKYQREYTWGVNDWDALFNDLMENEEGYFLGSYICVTDSSLACPSLDVIDGQQRFTSITLLLASLYKKLGAFEEGFDNEEKQDYANLRCILANKFSKATPSGKSVSYKPRLSLQKQNSNDVDYYYALYSAGVTTEKCEKPSNYGNRRIAKAITRFMELIDETVAEMKENNPDVTDISAMSYIAEKVKTALLVGIEVDSRSDAYMLFESLNRRGVPLSALDLLKNTLISTAKQDADEVYEQWKGILSYVGPDDYSVQERFFRQYYNAFRDELNEPYSTSEKKYFFGPLATRTTIIKIYEALIKYDYHALLNDIYSKAQKYAILVGRNEDEELYSQALLDLSRISGAPSYILLMYLLTNQETLELSDDDIKELVNFLITFFVRRNITDVPNTRKLTKLFMDLIPEIRSLKSQKVKDIIKSTLKAESAPESLFVQKLNGSIYDDNPDAARFILCSIESLHQTKEIYSDLWSRDAKNKYIWTIEHVFPEGDNIPQSWVDMIADGDAKQAKQYQNDYVHTLGNLTITGYNSNLSNKPFDEKRDRTVKDKTTEKVKHVGYKNGLYLNKELAVETSWTIEKIKNRTNELVKLLLEMYKW